MAIMIPNLISDTKSDAEKNVFRWLKNDPKTNGWIVLHSYPLFHHESLILGEADFVIIAPNLGIFVLEVKGGFVERKDGAWYFTGKKGTSEPKKRGPFEQAEESIQSVMALIKRKYGNTSHMGKLLFGYGCAFPDMVFDYYSPEFDRRIIFDERNDGKIGEFIQSLSKYWISRFVETYGKFDDDKLPIKSDVSQLAYYLRPNFEDLTPLKTIFDTSAKQIEKLTIEQYQTLDGLEDNKRSLILGSAGTGKTLLAIQSFLKMTKEKNKKVAFFCYNKLLGNFLRKKVPIEFLSNGSYVGTITSFIASHLRQNGIVIHVDENEPNYYFKQLLPQEFLNLVYKDSYPEPFDAIIVDEAQDLFAEEYLLIFDSILKDGFQRGQWQFFADFENQDINLGNHISEADAKEKINNPATFRLTINCRNTYQICKEIENVASVKYKNIINQIDGLPVDHIEYEDQNKGAFLVDQKLEELIKENKIDPSEIIILSPKKKENSIISNSKFRITDYKVDINPKLSIDFSTIQAFKGLEKSIVILVDISTYNFDKLLYVGLSRARTGLYIFETKTAHLERINLMVGKIHG